MPNDNVSKQITASHEAAVRTIASLESLVHSLCRIAWTAESQKDHEAFHTLMFDLLPNIGQRLDKAAADLGRSPSGMFADGSMLGMFRTQ